MSEPTFPRPMFSAYLDSIHLSKKKYSTLLEPLCRQYDLTRNELDILLFLSNNPDFDRAADIVSIRRIAKSHVSLSVNNLGKRGLLIQAAGEGDRRTSHLKLTEAALPIITAGQQLQKKFYTQMFQGFTREELEQWGSMLIKIYSNIESMDIQPEDSPTERSNV